MAKFRADQRAVIGRQVTVKLPQKIAYDFDKFVEIQKSILDRLGCQACCSDIDIRWDIERDFVVGADGRLRDF